MAKNAEAPVGVQSPTLDGTENITQLPPKEKGKRGPVTNIAPVVIVYEAAPDGEHPFKIRLLTRNAMEVMNLITKEPGLKWQRLESNVRLVG